MPASRGFTLIELLVAAVIIAILAALAIPRLSGSKVKAFDAAAKGYNMTARHRSGSKPFAWWSAARARRKARSNSHRAGSPPLPPPSSREWSRAYTFVHLQHARLERGACVPPVGSAAVPDDRNPRGPKLPLAFCKAAGCDSGGSIGNAPRVSSAARPSDARCEGSTRSRGAARSHSDE